MSSPDDNVTDLRRLEEHITLRWEVLRHYDYIREPRSSGYRAVHLVVRRDTYRIEIQLRTERMHQWAQTVESFSGHYSANYKQDGDSDIQQLMSVLSRLDEAVERGDSPNVADRDAIRTIAARVRDKRRSDT